MRLITILLLTISVNAFGQTKGALENPSQGSYTSGIYMFSGWACDAELIEIVINGGSGLKAAYGTDRGDTKGICGDSDNGFGLLFNMANLGTGEHTAVAFADGLEIGRSTFSVQRLSTGEFLRGAEDLVVANNFPQYGQESWLWWVESAQNYVTAFEQPAVDPYDIAGIWWSDADNYVVNISTQRLYVDRVELYAVGAPADYTDSAIGGVSEGYGVGNTGTLFNILPEGIESKTTITLIDSVNAIVRIDSCISYDPNLVCGYPAGATIAVRKLAGPNTGRAAPQDGTPLVPVGGLGGDDALGE